MQCDRGRCIYEIACINAGRCRAIDFAQDAVRRETPQHDSGHPHLIDGEFQSDKYPTCPRGKVPLSVKDVTAQDLLWEYAQRRRPVDAEFAADLEIALKAKGYVPLADKVGALLTGNPKTGDELLVLLERRMGSMKMVGERDDLLLDAAIFVARTMRGLDYPGWRTDLENIPKDGDTEVDVYVGSMDTRCPGVRYCTINNGGAWIMDTGAVAVFHKDVTHWMLPLRPAS